MKIHNIRLGHATNSSSSHSFIFDPSVKYDDVKNDYFGWDNFVASSKETKSTYMSAMLTRNLKMPKQIVKLIIKGLDLPDTEMEIDHQSVFRFPKEFGTDTIDINFFNEFNDYVMRDGVVILGGNDNSEDDFASTLSGSPLDFGGWGRDMSDKFVCRKDGSWWTLFDRESGNRVVLSFVDNPEPFAPNTPMLMDIKITDFCSYGCSFCYQGSTVNGEHMTTNDVWRMSSAISDAKVFEVAIGGGEPTQCPQFVDFVTSLSRNGVNVNFTTKNFDLLENDNFAESWIDNVGAFAVSVSDPNELYKLDRIINIMKFRNYPLTKLTIQVIPAVLSKYNFEHILKWANRNNIRATLLGFKETGRGAKYKAIGLAKKYDKFDETTWISVLAELSSKNNLGRISIDTTLAARYKQQLDDIKLPEWLYHIEEGKYSMYLDAVQKKVGPSSYHLDKLVTFSGTVEAMFSVIEAV